MRIGEIMTREVVVVAPTTSLAEAAERMQAQDIGSLPVCDGDRLQGVVTDRDITVRATAFGQDPRAVTVRDVMTPDVVHCFDDDDVRAAARLMEERQIRRLLVLDRSHRLVGIVSLGDLAHELRADGLGGQVLERVSAPAQPAPTD